ncbi:MAG: DNA-3-methyladenine glycosylase 2 family protein [Cellvibrionaceae bacterium]
MLASSVCQKARISRDPRFDGKFFTAVKTTKIYCRSICPATTPKEENVIYYASAIEAANAGYRPCLRCRPDSAPDSPAWKGVNTTLERAIKLINEGVLQEGSLPLLAERLGIGERYLRQLFKERLGVSPKAYALYQQCLFAKQLLHQTRMPITQIALASGFKSVRRFNDCFQSQLKLTPSQIRQSKKDKAAALKLQLSFRPPYDWSYVSEFLGARAIPTLEWCDAHSYGRTFELPVARGYFTAHYIEDKNRFDVEIKIDNIHSLKKVVNIIRRILDLDVDIISVEKNIRKSIGKAIKIKPGLRLPGIWTMFEAGIRAVLGQQVSVAAAHNLVARLVNELGETIDNKKLFPTPQAIVDSDLAFFKMPGSRKQTLKNLAQHYIDNNNPDIPEDWLLLKGVGPWTVNYACLRGLSEPDIYLGGDLGVKKAEEAFAAHLNPELAAPWRSYLTLQLWRQL